MFLAGKKSSELKSEISKEVVCPNCKASNSTKVSVFGTYKHLLQIPFVAGNKFGISNCLSCNQKYNLAEMPSLIKLAYYELKETSKTPFWFYAGIMSIKVLVLIKIFSKYY